MDKRAKTPPPKAAVERPPSKSVADMMADAGRAMYGETEWLRLFADTIGVDQRTVRGWLSGRTTLHLNNEVIPRTIRLLRARSQATARAAEQLDRLLRERQD